MIYVFPGYPINSIYEIDIVTTEKDPLVAITIRCRGLAHVKHTPNIFDLSLSSGSDFNRFAVRSRI